MKSWEKFEDDEKTYLFLKAGDESCHSVHRIILFEMLLQIILTFSQLPSFSPNFSSLSSKYIFQFVTVLSFKLVLYFLFEEYVYICFVRVSNWEH